MRLDFAPEDTADALDRRIVAAFQAAAARSVLHALPVALPERLAVLVCVRAGIDAAKIPEALAGGRADSRQLQEMFPKMVRSDYSITGRAALMLKDLELIHDLARGVGAPMPVTAGVTELFRKMVADGLGERDNTELVNAYRGKQS